MTIENTLDERQKTHGEFKTQASISQHLKDIVKAQDNYGVLEDYQREALDMIMHKVARILNGNPNFADHWHDIAGYATLVEKELSKGEEKSDFGSKIDYLENMIETLDKQEKDVNSRLENIREGLAKGFEKPAEYEDLEKISANIRNKRFAYIDDLTRLKKENKDEDV